MVYTSPANPSYNAEELQHQLSISEAKFIVVHSACLSAANKASKACGLSDNSMLLINRVTVPTSLPLILTLEDAILFGWSKGENYKAVRFKPGEARKTIAFLSFSSGTTGNWTHLPMCYWLKWISPRKLKGKPKVCTHSLDLELKTWILTDVPRQSRYPITRS